jgi:hypothetical protein
MNQYWAISEFWLIMCSCICPLRAVRELDEVSCPYRMLIFDIFVVSALDGSRRLILRPDSERNQYKEREHNGCSWT